MPPVSRRSQSVLLAMLPICLVPISVSAAGVAPDGASDAVFLAQIIALLVCGKLLGELMQRLGQLPVMGQLIAGVLLGPSVFGASGPGFGASCFRRARNSGR
jgi:hypothetical protein